MDMVNNAVEIVSHSGMVLSFNLRSEDLAAMCDDMGFLDKGKFDRFVYEIMGYPLTGLNSAASIQE